MGLGEQKDLFRPQDIFIIKSMDNLKAMEQRIGYLYEKRYKEAQEYEKQKIQMANEGNQQTVIVSEQAKQQTLQTEYGLKAELEQLIWQKEKDLLITKMEYEARNTDVRENARVYVGDKTAEAKVQSALVQSETDVHKSQVQADSSLIKQNLANEGLITKQVVANQKPAAKGGEK